MNLHRIKIALLGSALTAAPVLAQHEGHGEAGKARESAAPAATEPEDEGFQGQVLATRTKSPELEAYDHPEINHPRIDYGAIAGHDMAGMDMSATSEGAPAMASAGSGTARLPGAEGAMHGLHIPAGDWMVMAHGYVSAQYTDHKGTRGDDLLYSTSMLMLTGERNTGWGRIQLKSMLSLEPTMSARGYPNLFATGETAGGAPLVDRQHPHDLFMELAARVDVNIADGTSLFLYGGPVGEPALGPSAFMMRRSAAYNPEPPIAHHWFDATHITYGVVTTGIAARHVQVEASAFRGREPDERRWNIETPKLDSWSVRATWSPTPNWTAQLSHGFIKSPESSHVGQNERRTTASVHYANGKLAAMAAFSAKDRSPGPVLTAWLAEVTYDVAEHHAVFGRVENVDNDELVPDHNDPLHDQPFRVSKTQLGYAWHSPLGDSPFSLALGGSANLYGKPAALDRLYGSNPWGYTLFARLTLGH